MTQEEYIKEVATRLLKRYPAFEQRTLNLTIDKMIELISDPITSKAKYSNSFYKSIEKVGTAVDHFNTDRTVDQSVSLLQGPIEHIIYNKFNSVAEQVVSLTEIAKTVIKEKNLKETTIKIVEDSNDIERYFDYD